MRKQRVTGVALVAVSLLSTACATEEVLTTSSTTGTVVTTTTSLINHSSTTSSSPGPTPDLCQLSDSSCVGPLAPGIHTTANLITPLTFEVPEGWSKQLDVAGSVGLQSDAVPEGWIAIIPDWAIASQNNCTSDPEEGLGRTVDDLVTWLTEHQGLVTSAPSPASLGGLEGQVLDVRKDPEWNGPCSGRVSLFTHQGTINDVGWRDVNDFARLRLHFLDAGNGHTVTVHIETANEASFEKFIEIATPIVEGFEFEAGP